MCDHLTENVVATGRKVRCLNKSSSQRRMFSSCVQRWSPKTLSQDTPCVPFWTKPGNRLCVFQSNPPLVSPSSSHEKTRPPQAQKKKPIHTISSGFYWKSKIAVVAWRTHSWVRCLQHCVRIWIRAWIQISWKGSWKRFLRKVPRNWQKPNCFANPRVRPQLDFSEFKKNSKVFSVA